MSLDEPTHHQSDSSAQRSAEGEVRALLAAKLGVVLEPRRIELQNGSYVDVDGVDPDCSVFAEVFARIGTLKGGQLHKVSTDALKFTALRAQFPKARFLLAFLDESAAACVTGKSWRAEALRTHGIEVHVLNVAPATRAAVEAAQVRQRMVNAVIEE